MFCILFMIDPINFLCFLREIDFNSVDGNSRTLISYALESQNIELISYLSKCGAWIHTSDAKIEVNCF